MAQRKKNAEDFEFIEGGTFKEIDGELVGFFKAKFNSILIGTKDGVKALGISVVMDSLFHANKELLVVGAPIRIVKKNKPKGKRYFIYDIYIDDEKLTDDYGRMSADEMFA